jgi:hypothetical protein
MSNPGRIIISVAMLSSVLVGCVVSAAAQTKSGATQTRFERGVQRSRKQADAGSHKLTADLKKQLSAEMLKNAFNPEWFRKCMEDAGGIDKIVDIEPVSLGSSDARQYLLSGKIVENGESCAFGARAPMYWIYENRGGKIRLLADIGAADGVKPISRRTNGYRDIQIGAFYNAGRSFSTTYLKYNGTIYK